MYDFVIRHCHVDKQTCGMLAKMVYLGPMNGQQKEQTKPISTKTCPDGWCRVEFDLSDWSGRTITLELLNEASGWRYEAGYWSELKIDVKTLSNKIKTYQIQL